MNFEAFIKDSFKYKGETNLWKVGTRATPDDDDVPLIGHASQFNPSSDSPEIYSSSSPRAQRNSFLQGVPLCHIRTFVVTAFKNFCLKNIALSS